MVLSKRGFPRQVFIRFFPTKGQMMQSLIIALNLQLKFNNDGHSIGFLPVTIITTSCFETAASPFRFPFGENENVPNSCAFFAR
jgi:hypothetical protein